MKLRQNSILAFFQMMQSRLNGRQFGQLDWSPKIVSSGPSFETGWFRMSSNDHSTFHEHSLAESCQSTMVYYVLLLFGLATQLIAGGCATLVKHVLPLHLLKSNPTPHDGLKVYSRIDPGSLCQLVQCKTRVMKLGHRNIRARSR